MTAPRKKAARKRSVTVWLVGWTPCGERVPSVTICKRKAFANSFARYVAAKGLSSGAPPTRVKVPL